MAFSGFGSSTTPSLFGQSKPAGSLFGSTQPATSGTSSFGQPQPQSQQPTTSLFGQPAGGAHQQQPTTSIFGQPATGSQQSNPSLFGQPAGATQQQQQPTASLFGQPATGSQQPAPTLFGQPAGATQQQQQQQPTTSLFGQTASGTQQQQQPTTSFFGQPAGGTQPTTSLFGQPASAAQQQQPQSSLGTSLFGTTTQSNAPPTQTTGLFGSSTQTQPATSGTSLFGGAFQPQGAAPMSGFGASTAGSSLFGPQRQTSNMSISPSQPTGPVLFSKATKFNDLPDDIKKKFEGLDSHIQGRVQINNDLKQRKLGQEATKGQELIRNVHKELLSVAATIQSDVLFTKDLKAKTDQAVQDTIVATRIIDGFRNPHQNGVYLKNYASFPLEFFTRVTQQMQERLQWYKNTIEQIERKLSSAAMQAQSTPQVISSTLQTQHAIFVSLAAKTAAVDAELQKVKTLYTQLWRTKTGSMRDPFNDLDRGSGGDFGMESLRLM
ncbi:hypothetical protein BS17DRAFT_781372 [Gyrodon lividus]|nr:hypothetical protein BS17DRAFT_781372 [Gyrodon lividus]